MTKEEAGKWAELYKACAEGKTIQQVHGDTWLSINSPEFNLSIGQYRVKPVPKKSIGYRVYLINVFRDMQVCAGVAWEHQDYSEDIERSPGFIKWLDDNWVYAEYEE